MEFCKVFNRGTDQFVVLKQYDDSRSDPWTLSLLCQPHGCDNFCEVALGFSTQEKREAMFNKVDLRIVLDLTKDIFDCFPEGEFNPDAFASAYGEKVKG